MLFHQIRKLALLGALAAGIPGSAYLEVKGWWWGVCLPFPFAVLLYLVWGESPELLIRKANRRSLHLLLDSLSPVQRKFFIWKGWFLVRGSDGHIYKVRDDSFWNISSDDRELRGLRLCAYPRDVPRYDEILGQKLLLETNADLFRSLANKTFYKTLL